MMIRSTFARSSPSGFVSKIASRLIGSVVPTSDLTVQDDFSVKNEPVLSYLPGSQERQELQAALAKYQAQEALDIPIMIGDHEYRTDYKKHQVMPFDHSRKVASFYYATPDLVEKAIDTGLKAKEEWSRLPMEHRISLFRKVADLMATKYRADLNATTMLGQGKTVIQAEIDAAAEMVDFFRFNSYFSKELMKYQPISDQPDVSLNLMRFRPLEGFVASISPFNFTAIAGNLAFSPALMGNCVVWKPSDTAILSNFLIYKIFKEAGFPPGLVNFVPSDGPSFGTVVTSHPELAAINFTGSVPTFQWLWKSVAEHMHNFSGFPRLVGECGGKNFHFVHQTADVDSVVAATIRSSFEYQGQKCSACSRMYVPESLWPKIKEGLLEAQKSLKVGPVTEFDSFMSAVIDEKAFERISDYIQHAKHGANTKILAGGHCDDRVGYFVEPTIIQTTCPGDKMFREEIFGPVVTAYVYKDKECMNILKNVPHDSKYALTGSIFTQDQGFADEAADILKGSSGNFYVNDRSTGSVVGQQPFGGAKLSGTNDKAGGPHYMLKWASPQSIKQTFVPIPQIKYPYMTKD